MTKPVGLAARCGFSLLAVTVLVMPVPLMVGAIDLGVYFLVSVIWLLVSAALIQGESITEIRLWKASIKRDARAAEEARKGAEEVLEQLRDITRLVIENEYVLLSGSELANHGHPSVEHVQNNLNALTDKILIAGLDKELWQSRMTALMKHPYDYGNPAPPGA